MKIFVLDGVLSDLYVVNALPCTESTVGSWVYHIRSSFLKSNSQLLLIEVFWGKIHHRIFGWQSSKKYLTPLLNCAPILFWKSILCWTKIIPCILYQVSKYLSRYLCSTLILGNFLGTCPVWHVDIYTTSMYILVRSSQSSAKQHSLLSFVVISISSRRV